jgi:mevalonate kinase
MTTIFPKYNSKILLFGEYTLLSGSKALIIPFNRYRGSLEFSKSETIDTAASNKSLREFSFYLQKQKDKFPQGLGLDTERFQSDLNKGLFLNSNVPQGYGVGSSGVVVASVYGEYSIRSPGFDTGSDLAELKSWFSLMESYFHGKSSGLDPLACYLGKPLLVSSSGETKIVDFPSGNRINELTIFLLDTGIASETEGFVRSYLDKSIKPEFISFLAGQLIPLNNSCIDSILYMDILNFLLEIHLFSALQIEYFAAMIPVSFREIWQNGINTGDYSLKLCGSGGGGYILGFTTEVKKTKEYFSNQGIKLIPVFNNNYANFEI